MRITKPISLAALPDAIRAEHATALKLANSLSLSRAHATNILASRIHEWTPRLLAKFDLELMLKQGSTAPFPLSAFRDWLKARYPSGVALATATGLSAPAANALLRGASRMPDAKARAALGLTLWVRSIPNSGTLKAA